MQKIILNSKNKITLVSAILIALAFTSKWMTGNDAVFTSALVIASILGVMPIAIQAYQALRVKVVSIDVLVTIAVIGAFLIQNFEESAIVTFLFLFGGYLEQRTLNKTRSAITELTAMAAESALKQLENGEFETVDVDDVDKGDVLLVRTGALVIGVPVSNVAGIGNGARNGVLLKGSEVIFDFSKVDTILFDKTGTLTVGNPSTNNLRPMLYKVSLRNRASYPSGSMFQLFN